MKNHLDLATTHYFASEEARWKTCLIAAAHVGEHQNGFSRELANQLGFRDVSRVSDLADAGRARKELGLPFRIVSRFRVSVFTYAWKVINAGHDPQEVSQVLLDMLAEWDRFYMADVTEGLAGHFNMPVRELKPLPLLDKLVTWGASKVSHKDRPAWDQATQTIRRILHEHTP
jgi:hypothetical protein